MPTRRCAPAALRAQAHDPHGARDRRGARYRIDVNTLQRDQAADELGAQRDRPRPAAHQRAAARSTRTAQPGTGGFILIDEATNDTVGAGMITAA